MPGALPCTRDMCRTALFPQPLIPVASLGYNFHLSYYSLPCPTQSVFLDLCRQQLEKVAQALNISHAWIEFLTSWSSWLQVVYYKLPSLGLGSSKFIHNRKRLSKYNGCLGEVLEAYHMRRTFVRHVLSSQTKQPNAVGDESVKYPSPTSSFTIEL